MCTRDQGRAEYITHYLLLLVCQLQSVQLILPWVKSTYKPIPVTLFVGTQQFDVGGFHISVPVEGVAEFLLRRERTSSLPAVEADNDEGEETQMSTTVSPSSPDLLTPSTMRAFLSEDRGLDIDWEFQLLRVVAVADVLGGVQVSAIAYNVLDSFVTKRGCFLFFG